MESHKGQVIQIVRFKTDLPESEVVRIAKERQLQFQNVPGLLQKFYTKYDNDPRSYGGVYVWESLESLKAYRETDLAKTIASAYHVAEAPSVEVVPVLFKLR